MLKLSGFEKFDNKGKGKGGVKARSGVNKSGWFNGSHFFHVW